MQKNVEDIGTKNKILVLLRYIKHLICLLTKYKINIHLN